MAVIGRPVPCTARLASRRTDKQTDRQTDRQTQTKYRNPRCACAPRVNDDDDDDDEDDEEYDDTKIEKSRMSGFSRGKLEGGRNELGLVTARYTRRMFNIDGEREQANWDMAAILELQSVPFSFRNKTGRASYCKKREHVKLR